jgi:hypothetical protein
MNYVKGRKTNKISSTGEKVTECRLNTQTGIKKKMHMSEIMTYFPHPLMLTAVLLSLLHFLLFLLHLCCSLGSSVVAHSIVNGSERVCQHRNWLNPNEQLLQFTYFCSYNQPSC